MLQKQDTCRYGTQQNRKSEEGETNYNVRVGNENGKRREREKIMAETRNNILGFPTDRRTN